MFAFTTPERVGGARQKVSEVPTSIRSEEQHASAMRLQNCASLLSSWLPSLAVIPLARPVDSHLD